MNVMTKPIALDVERIRKDFPILTQTVRGKKLVFLDSAASAQKPRAVIDAMVLAMETQYANVHRGLHWMSERTTEAYEFSARRCRGFDERQRSLRNHIHPQQDRGAQPDGPQLRARRAEARPGGADFGHGAPFQHRAVANATRFAWDRTKGRAGHRRRRTRHGCL